MLIQGPGGPKTVDDVIFPEDLIIKSPLCVYKSGFESCQILVSNNRKSKIGQKTEICH